MHPSDSSPGGCSPHTLQQSDEGFVCMVCGRVAPTIEGFEAVPCDPQQRWHPDGSFNLAWAGRISGFMQQQAGRPIPAPLPVIDPSDPMVAALAATEVARVSPQAIALMARELHLTEAEVGTLLAEQVDNMVAYLKARGQSPGSGQSPSPGGMEGS